MESIQILKSKGVRPSVQRIAILDYLLSHFTHPTAEEVFEELNPQMPTLSKTTIYNTMKLFEAQGVIQVIHVDERNVRMDADLTPHAHFICIECGDIYDIPLNLSTSEYAALTSTAIKDARFHVFDTQIYHKGLCVKCIKKQQN